LKTLRPGKICSQSVGKEGSRYLPAPVVVHLHGRRCTASRNGSVIMKDIDKALTVEVRNG